MRLVRLVSKLFRIVGSCSNIDFVSFSTCRVGGAAKVAERNERTLNITEEKKRYLRSCFCIAVTVLGERDARGPTGLCPAEDDDSFDDEFLVLPSVRSLVLIK